MSDESVCLDVPNIHVSRPTVYFLACRQQHKQKWKYQNNVSIKVMHDLSLAVIYY